MLTLSSLLIAIALISFFAFDLPEQFSKWFYGVYVVPKTITIHPTNWSLKKEIQVVNNKPYPIYAVQLRISELENDTNINDVQIELPEYPLDTRFSSSTNMNGFIINGFSRINGKRWRYVPIYKINANSHIDIGLTIPAIANSERFRLEITGFNREATNILEQENTTFVPFRLN